MSCFRRIKLELEVDELLACAGVPGLADPGREGYEEDDAPLVLGFPPAGVLRTGGIVLERDVGWWGDLRVGYAYGKVRCGPSSG